MIDVIERTKGMSKRVGPTPEQAIAATPGMSNDIAKTLIDDMLDFIGNCCETAIDFGCCDPIDCKYLSGDGKLAECTRYQDFLSRAKAIAATLGGGVNPDGLPIGLTISDDGTLLNWEGENYVLQSIVRDVKRKPNGDAARRCRRRGSDERSDG